MKAFPSRLPVLLLCLCAVTALTLPTGLPASSAQAADFYMIGGSGGAGGSNALVNTEGIGGAAVGNAGAGGSTILNHRWLARTARAAAERSLEI